MRCRESSSQTLVVCRWFRDYLDTRNSLIPPHMDLIKGSAAGPSCRRIQPANSAASPSPKSPIRSFKAKPRSSIVRIEPVLTLRTSIENRRPLIRTPQLHLAELHLRMMALRTLFVGELLRVYDGLRDLEGGKIVALALEGRGVVGAARGRG
jgi:hypothetical protein